MQRATKKVEKKRLVRYKEGAEMYSMGMNKFQTLAKDAGAILKIDRMVLVDLDINILKHSGCSKRIIFDKERFSEKRKIHLTYG